MNLCGGDGEKKTKHQSVLAQSICGVVVVAVQGRKKTRPGYKRHRQGYNAKALVRISKLT